MRLTKRDIERASKRRKYSDGRGLFLSVSANGRKTWAFCYTFGGRAREMGLGSIDFVSVDEARDRAVHLRKMVREGVDPMADRNREAKVVVRRKGVGVTFKSVADRFIDMKKPEWGEGGKSENDWRGSLGNHVFPFIGATNIAELDTMDVRDALKKVWGDSPSTARKLLPRVEAVFDYALAEGLLSGDNPADRRKVKKLLPRLDKVHKATPHKALDYAGIPAFMAQLRARPGVAAKAMEFLILTGVRTSEVIGAKWDEIDLEGATWTIPADRMKADREHRVPLTPAALTLLRALPGEEGNPFLFISPSERKKGQGLSNMAMLKLLKEDMGYAGTATVHGFRAVFRTWVAEETTHDNIVAEMALAHTIGSKVEAAYRRGDLFERRKALMADWSAYCAGAAA
jgi:integrase